MEVITGMSDSTTATKCYDYFMHKFNSMKDDKMDEELEDIHTYIETLGVGEVSNMSFELFRIWHLEGEIKLANDELIDL